MKAVSYIVAAAFLALWGFSCGAKDITTDYKQLSSTIENLKITIDTTYIKSYKKLNDYTLLGIQYGVALSTPSFQPVRNSKMVFIPVNVGITWTKFCKMFGYMPYFGLQVGAFYTKDAYEFETSSSGYTDNILGAYKATMQVIEVPALAMFHYDFWKMRIMADVGIFGGWRMSIHREYKEGAQYDPSLQDSFSSVENRFDYGIKAGAGFALIFDPIEIHITASYKYSWSNLYQPNYLSKYYYKWAYPTNIVIGVGVHYQLTRRVGTPTHEIKRQAREEAELMMEELRRKQREQARTDSLAAAALLPPLPSQKDSLSAPSDSLSSVAADSSAVSSISTFTAADSSVTAAVPDTLSAVKPAKEENKAAVKPAAAQSKPKTVQEKKPAAKQPERKTSTAALLKKELD